MNKWLGIILLNALPISLLFGQDTVAVYRADLLEKIAEQNLTLKVANKEAEMARADFNQSRALYLPSITASHTATYSNNPLVAFGSKLNQETLTEQDFNPNLLNDPDAIQNYATEFMVMQPIINLDGIHEREAARIQSEAMLLKAQRTQEYLEFEVLSAYMQLQLGYDAVEVIRRSQSVAQEALTIINDYYEQGLVQKSDVLSVQVRANDVANQLNQTLTNVRNGSDYLSLLLGEQMGESVYKPQDRLVDSLFTADYSNTIPESRKDLQAMEMAVAGYESMLTSGKMKFLPRINAFGSYQFYDDNLFGFDADGYLLGVNLSWQLFNGNKHIGQLQKKKAEFEKAQFENDQYRQNSELEFKKTKRQLVDAAKKVELTKLAFQQSSEAFRIKQDRFKEGLEKATDYLMAETLMFQKELAYRQAIFEYNITSEYLKFLTK